MHARPRRMRPFVMFALGLWALAPAASAQVYRWVDPDGSIHYSDSPASAPKNAKVETTTGDDITVEGTGRVGGGSTAVVTTVRAGSEPTERPPAPPAPPAQPTDGADEQTVRQYFRSTHQRIAEAERQIAEQKKVVESADAAHTAGCRGTREECLAWAEQQRAYREETRQHLAKLEGDLRKWRSYLDDLERWASSKAIPRSWRQ